MLTVADLPDVAPAPAALVERVREARARADAAEVEILVLAVEWAHAHPVLDGGEAWRVPRTGSFLEHDEPSDESELEDHGIPPVQWSAPAAFAAANRMSTTAGRALLRDALVLRHRLSLTWRQLAAGDVPAWRARRVAQRLLGEPEDVMNAVDARLEDTAGSIGPITLDRIVEEELIRLHAEEVEIAREVALDARHARLDERSIGHTGIAELVVRGDWTDVHDLHLALDVVADALAAADDHRGESHEVLRTVAAGVLADPARALALLSPGAGPAPKPRDLTLYVHLRRDDELFAHEGADGLRPVLAEQVRAWAGRPDLAVVVKPVIDLDDDRRPSRLHAPDVPGWLRERTALIHSTCVFPWCERPARLCDCDHVVPHAEGGPTCQANLAPLCRHHHRLKTHAGWRYAPLEPQTYLWSDPHGQHFLRDPRGTTDVTDRTGRRRSPPRVVAQGDEARPREHGDVEQA